MAHAHRASQPRPTAAGAKFAAKGGPSRDGVEEGIEDEGGASSSGSRSESGEGGGGGGGKKRAGKEGAKKKERRDSMDDFIVDDEAEEGGGSGSGSEGGGSEAPSSEAYDSSDVEEEAPEGRRGAGGSKAAKAKANAAADRGGGAPPPPAIGYSEEWCDWAGQGTEIEERLLGDLEQRGAEASCKTAFVAALLDELVGKGHRVLVFSQSRVMLDIMQVGGGAGGARRSGGCASGS
jgi:hypothetical protein